MEALRGRVFGFWSTGDSTDVHDMLVNGWTWRTLGAAMDSLRWRMAGRDRDPFARTVELSEDGYAVPGVLSGDLYPAGKWSIELYRGKLEPGRGWWVAEVPFARIRVGPRGGVVVDRW